MRRRHPLRRVGGLEKRREERRRAAKDTRGRLNNDNEQNAKRMAKALVQLQGQNYLGCKSTLDFSDCRERLETTKNKFFP